jgi:hypothetical protein
MLKAEPEGRSVLKGAVLYVSVRSYTPSLAARER